MGRELRGHQPIAMLWREHGAAILASWVREHPGTRPSLWWKYDAPAWVPDELPDHFRGAFFAAELREPRRRVGGTGTATHDCLAHVPQFERGIPRQWIDQETVDRYNGRGIGPRSHWTQDWVEGSFPYNALDPDDPPAFESEAVYLHRHGLLTPDEGRSYALGQLDLEPELVQSEAGDAFAAWTGDDEA
jgi:hypothetical protein